MSKQGEFIKNARRKMGLTQKQLADRLNVSDKVVSKWEVGDSFPDYMLLPHLAKLLQVDVQEILNGEYTEKPNVVAETKEVVYVERKSTDKPTTFGNKIINALRFMFKYRSIFFASFLGLSLILMFCRFFSWEVPQLGFKNNFFKLLFAPFQKDLNKYLYGDFVSALNSQFTTNTNILIYIISALIWFYLLFIVFNIIKFIKSAIKKEDIDKKSIFKRTLTYSILTVVLFILSFILKSQFIKMFNSSGATFDNYESMGMGAKTCSVLPMLWSFVVIAFSAVFNYVKSIYTKKEKVENSTIASSNTLVKGQNVVVAKEPKQKVELTEEQKLKRKKAKKLAIVFAIVMSVISAGIGGIFIYNNFKPSPQNTVKAYLNNLNSSQYESNLNLIYGMNDDDRQNYENMTYSYKLYSNLSLSSLNTVYEEDGFGLYSATITGNYIVSGNSSLTTYKVDIPVYKNNGKYLLLEPIDFIYGSSCNCDKENRCVTKNNQLVLYYGNNIDSFVIPNGVTSLKNTFYNNINNNGTYRILYNVATSNPKTYTPNSQRITLTEPTRNGYTFNGWIGTNINQAQKTVIIDSGSTGDKYYIAVWTPITYSISYQNVSSNTNPTSYTIESDDIILNYPTKSHYSFLGWTGTGLSRQTANVTIPKGSYGNRTYTANWAADGFRITYNMNGGTNNSSNPSVYDYDTALTLAEPTKTGYTFTGWTGSNGSTPQTSVTILKNSTGDKTYTANWLINNYTISYNLNGGYVNSSNKTSYNVETYTFTLNNPTKNGYTFKGWTGSNGNTPQTIVTISKGSTGDKTYTANWEMDSYSISYNMNGGTNSSSNPTSFNCETSTFTLVQPTKFGYTFTGWTGSNGSTPQTSIKITKGSTGNRNYTANWTINTYTITYDLNDGTLNGTNPTSFTVESDTFTLTNPTHSQYEFAGWTGSNGNIPQKNITINKGSTGNRNYKANFLIDYTIEYELNGGIIDGTNPTTYNIFSDDFTLINPIKTDYTFTGWTGSNGLIPQTSITISKGSYGNKTYTANWDLISYSISYDLNGGINNSNNPNSYNIQTETFSLLEPTKNGYEFIGWTNSEIITPQKNITISKGSLGNKSYTANWDIIEYTITYILNGGTNSNSNPTSYTIESDEISLTPAIFANEKVSRWYSDSNFQNRIISIPTGSYGNITLYARGGYDISELFDIDGTTLVKCHQNLINEFKLLNILIPNNIKTIGEYAFNECSNLISLTIPSSVTSIGDYAFLECYKLAELYNLSKLQIYKGSSSNGYIGCYSKVIHSSVNEESSVAIDENGFQFCWDKTNRIGYCIGYSGSLTNISIPSTFNLNGEIKSVTAINDRAFYNCDSLISIIIPNSVRIIENFAFKGCNSLYEITLPFIGNKLNGTSNTYFGYIFGVSSNKYIPKSLENVTITGGSSISEYSFDGCSFLKNIIIPYSVTNIERYAFNNCSSLVNISISEGVKSIGEYAFCNCSSLINITLPNSIINIGRDVFLDCSLLNYTIKNNIKYLGNRTNPYLIAVSVTDNSLITYKLDENTKIVTCFSNCNSLKNIEIPNGVISVGEYAFKNCNSLTRVDYFGTIEDWCRIYFKSNPLSYAHNLYINNKIVENVEIPNTITELKNLVFSGMTCLKSITISDSVTSIGRSAFSNCSSLKNVIIGNSVTNIGDYSFYKCSSLATIIISDSVNTIGQYAFYDCISLTSITLPNSIERIDSYAFCGCIKLVEIYNLSKLQITKNSDNNGYLGNYVKVIHFSSNEESVIVTDENGFQFYWDKTLNVGYCIGYVGDLTDISIPSTFNFNEQIKTVTLIYAYAFSNCYNLINVTIPNSVINIGSCAFNKCSSLVNIILPNSITNIGSGAFYDCSSLTYIIVPDNVTSINVVTFSNCSSLTNITIPNSVKSIEHDAFDGCSSLENVIFENASGWKADKVELSVSELSNSKIAANYLKSTYRTSNWIKED